MQAADDIEHGGDLAAAMATFPVAPTPWIDLSTGINPWPYPVEGIDGAAWARLPGAGDMTALLAAAAIAYGASPNRMVAAPGSQALIQWLPQLWQRASSRIAVLSPSYGEHARSWAAAGHAVALPTDLDAVAADIDVLVIGRPNNPDGRIVPLDRLADLADRQARRGGWLILDEAFADATPEASVIGRLESPSVIVLRSFGKFYGLAGARLGIAVAEPNLVARLRRALGPWCVAGPTLVIATRALADTRWSARTRTRLATAAAELDDLLEAAGMRPLGGTPLFRLAEAADAPDRYRQLLAAGILVRRFAATPTRLRFGLPPNPAATHRLVRALAPHHETVGAGGQHE
ncbi:MAG TPA: threonine-phosphate decarboxylase CobD [Stellaceae bacterium]|nr:threonine-phosphate decarboxylase CobD [Stellaceae bacterium]